MTEKKSKDELAKQLVDREVLANQDELVNVLLEDEKLWLWDEIVNLRPRVDIDELIRFNPREYEEFILDNGDLLTETYSDEYDEWQKHHYNLDIGESEEPEAFLDWLEEFAPFSDEEGEIRMTRRELLRNIELDEDDIDTLYDYFERNRVTIEDEGHEIFSWYLVTDWLADKLEAEGETILRYYSQSWWGRSTYGQLILADGVIQKIAWALWGDVEGEEDGPDKD